MVGPDKEPDVPNVRLSQLAPPSRVERTLSPPVPSATTARHEETDQQDTPSTWPVPEGNVSGVHVLPAEVVPRMTPVPLMAPPTTSQWVVDRQEMPESVRPRPALPAPSTPLLHPWRPG